MVYQTDTSNILDTLATHFPNFTLDNALFTGEETIEHQILADYRYALARHSEWRRKTRASYDFFKGVQWDTFLKRKLEASVPPKPALTINQILPVVNQVMGHFWINQFDTKVYAMENADDEVADILTMLIKFIDDQIFGKREVGQAFFDMLISGIGWLNIGMDFETDIVEGEVLYKQFSPLDILYDPDLEGNNINRADYLIKELRFNKKTLLRHYPKAKYILNDVLNWRTTASYESERDPSQPHHQSKPGGTYEDAIRNPLNIFEQRKPYKVIEYIYKDYEETVFIYSNDDDRLFRFTPTEYSTHRGTFEDDENYQVIYRHVPTVKTASMLIGPNQLIEGPVKHPTSTTTYPFVPIFGYDALGDRFGVVENLKEIQQERNKRRSQILEIMLAAPQPGLTIEDDAMSKSMLARLKREGVPAGAIISVFPGKASGVHERKQVSFPQAFYQMELEAKEDIYETSGVNRDMLGFREGGIASGRAVGLRHKQAAVSLQTFMENLRFARRGLGRLIIELIQKNYTKAKTFRILGRQYSINERDIDSDGVTRILNDITVGKYDIVIGEGESTVTARMARFEENMRIFDSRVVEVLPREVVVELAREVISSSEASPDFKARIDNMKDIMAQMPPLGQEVPFVPKGSPPKRPPMGPEGPFAMGG